MATARSSSARKRRPEVDLATELQIVKVVESTEEKWTAQLEKSTGELKSITGELRHKQDGLEQNIRTVEQNLSKKIDDSVKGVMDHFDASVEKFEAKMDIQNEKMDKRVGVLERLRWLILGGVVVFFWILGNVAFDKVSEILNK